MYPAAQNEKLIAAMFAIGKDWKSIPLGID
jgi:hypothetical protein